MQMSRKSSPINEAAIVSEIVNHREVESSIPRICSKIKPTPGYIARKKDSCLNFGYPRVRFRDFFRLPSDDGRNETNWILQAIGKSGDREDRCSGFEFAATD